MDHSGWRLPAKRLEQDLASAVQRHLTRAIHQGAIRVNGAGELQRLQAAVAELGANGLALISRVDLAADRLSIRLDRPATIKALAITEPAMPPEVMMFSIPAKLRRRGVEARFIIGDATPERDDILIANIARAEAWRLQIIAGSSLADIAESENRTTGYVAQMLEFAFLAPDLLTEVLAGRQPSGLTTNWLRRHSLPADWAEQRRQLAQL